MSTIPRIFIFLFTATIAFAQLDSNSVTVSASRNTSLQADQAVFAINVTSPLTTNLTDVVAAVQSAGLTLSNFQNVSTTQGGFVPLPGGPTGPPVAQPNLQWVFALPVPVSKIKDTATALNTLQQSIAQSKNGMTMSFSVAGTQVSPGLQQSQVCPIPDLLSDARAQAQKLAEAANMTVGAILAMSSSTATVIPGSGVPVTAYLGSFSSITPPIGTGCFVTVKYGLK